VTVAFSVALDQADYLAANRLLFRRNWLWRGILKISAWAGGAYGSLIFAMDVLEEGYTLVGLAVTAVMGAVFGLVMGPLLALVCWLMLPGSVRRIYAQQGTVSLRSQWQVNELGYRCANGEETVDQPWSRLMDFVQDDHYLLLRRMRGSFFGIPKRQLDDAQLAGLIGLLRSAGVKETT